VATEELNMSFEYVKEDEKESFETKVNKMMKPLL